MFPGKVVILGETEPAQTGETVSYGQKPEKRGIRMIQDIFPKTLKNQYREKEPVEESRIFVFRERQILIGQDADQNLSLPRFKEIREQMAGEALGNAGEAEGILRSRLQYYFSIDDTDYFGCKEVLEPFGEYGYAPVHSFRQMISKDICFGVMTAWHLYQWYSVNRFCGRCGKATLHDQRERMVRCPACGNVIYPKIAPAVIVALTDGDRILMTKYADREYKKYALLAGFTEIGETAEETVRREVMEEVGLRVKNIRYYKSQPWGIDSNLLLGFFCDLDGSDRIHRDEAELAEAQWFHREKMPAHDDGISLTREMMGVFEKGLHKM